MKIEWKHTAIILVTALLAAFFSFGSKSVEDTIIFFPIDPDLRFNTVATNLLARQAGTSQYQVYWKIESTLVKPVYLRQDISLLYKNGRLIGILKDWKQNQANLLQTKSFTEQESGLFESVSYHYGEVHPKANTYTSVQKMSKDHLYAILTPKKDFQAFHDSSNNEQRAWQHTFDKYTKSIVETAFTDALKQFGILENHYIALPLTDLASRFDELLKSFPPEQREEIIGKLWEGLYKNYVMGIKKEDGSILNPIGSTVPIVLVAKNHSELLILFQTSDGTPILLRQSL
ncbi:hypothetical protein [Peribacillus huizhouensis]|uniref:DUF3887 domain-containing protein n=1 Tax=Peribacillus huizhouensis TaxID=1501239 RepID=A0ABR6CKI9_9BACI|nr:hypothetical protein [Peribacillus huizhouensis]MBA9025419.1 hypothetical protein [Peribacillus huizhouensis]